MCTDKSLATKREKIQHFRQDRAKESPRMWATSGFAGWGGPRVWGIWGDHEALELVIQKGLRI